MVLYHAKDIRLATYYIIHNSFHSTVFVNILEIKFGIWQNFFQFVFTSGICFPIATFDELLSKQSTPKHHQLAICLSLQQLTVVLKYIGKYKRNYLCYCL